MQKPLSAFPCPSLPAPGSRPYWFLSSTPRNPVIDFVFQKQEHDVLDDANDGIIRVSSPDPGRALITGRADDTATFTFGHANAFKISPLRGIRKTAPYFQDNPAKTQLDEQDKKDIIAFLKLLD